MGYRHPVFLCLNGGLLNTQIYKHNDWHISNGVAYLVYKNGLKTSQNYENKT